MISICRNNTTIRAFGRSLATQRRSQRVSSVATPLQRTAACLAWLHNPLLVSGVSLIVLSLIIDGWRPAAQRLSARGGARQSARDGPQGHRHDRLALVTG